MFEVFYLFNTRYIRDPIFTQEGIFGNGYALAAIGLVAGFQFLFTYAPPMQKLFKTAAINPAAWVRIIIISTSVLVLVEIEKYFLRKYELMKI